MERLVVTGVDGVVGGNIATALADRFEVLGLHARTPLAIDGVATCEVDPRDCEAVVESVRHAEPDWIIHCGALSASSWDLAAETTAGQHEPRLVSQLAELASGSGARLTVISTDAIFGGPWMFQEENSADLAATTVARHAHAMELALGATDALVIRTHAYGWSPTGSAAGLAQQIWRSLSTGASLRPGGRRYATPILASDLADYLVRAFELKLQGLYHIGGAERTNSFRFATELAVACGFTLPSGAASDAAVLHQETSMNSRSIRRALDMPLPMLREGLARFAAQLNSGWRDRWHENKRPQRALVHAA